MTKIVYITPDGEHLEISASNGATVMQTAIDAGVPGIEAQCGGACACATCHVHIPEEWRDRTGEPGPAEDDLLDFTAERDAGSRLSCQILVDPTLDSLTVRVADEQG